MRIMGAINTYIKRQQYGANAHYDNPLGRARSVVERQSGDVDLRAAPDQKADKLLVDIRREEEQKVCSPQSYVIPWGQKPAEPGRARDEQYERTLAAELRSTVEPPERREYAPAATQKAKRGGTGGGRGNKHGQRDRRTNKSRKKELSTVPGQAGAVKYGRVFISRHICGGI